MSDSIPNSRAIDLSFLKKQEEKTVLRDNYLFVIGINEYQHCTPLGNAVNDAQSFAAVLNEKYRFKKDHTFSLINQEATINNIDDTFKTIKGKIRPKKDNLIVFFCGHGYYDKEWDTAYWVPVEAKADRALGEYFSHEDLMKRINAIKTHHTVVIADSCYSGAAFVSQKRSHDPNSMVFAKEPSRWMLASGRNEPVNDGKIDQNSPFTSELLDILEGESNAGIRMGTLVERLKTRVNNNYDQTPIGQPLKDVGDKGGEFIFFPQDKEEDKWREAKVKNTLEAYEFFLSEFKAGNFSPEAKTRIMEIRAENLFNQIQAAPTEELCQNYLDKYPKGKDLQAVSELKYELGEERFWANTKKENTLAAYEAYLAEYPNGRYVEEAKEGRDTQKNGLKAWKEADALYTIASFEAFIQHYKDSEYFDDATTKLKELKDWKHAKASKNAEMLEAFIKNYPDSPHLGKAEELLRNTAENKKKRMKHLIIAGVAVVSLVIAGLAFNSYNTGLRNTYIEKKGSAKAMVRGGYFTKVFEDLDEIPEKFQKEQDVVDMKSLTGFLQNMNGFLEKADSSFNAKEWKLAEAFYLDYQSNVQQAKDKLKLIEDDLKEVFQPYFAEDALVDIDSLLEVIRKEQDLDFVAARVMGISKKGDSLYIAGMYPEALEYYNSAKEADSHKAALYLDKKQKLAAIGDDLQEMILVPGGKYSLRSDNGKNEKSINSFYISKYEVTNKEYVAFLNEHIGSQGINNWISIEKSDISLKNGKYKINSIYKDFPVVAVSYKGAEAYAKWSDSQLPTELEWEYAASSAGDEMFEFSGSDRARDVANYYSGNAVRAKKTGRRKANKLGIHDMSGNVWEWVNTGNGDHMVIKGGSFNRGENFVKIESRHDQPVRRIGGPKSNGSYHTNDLGFRIIRRKK